MRGEQFLQCIRYHIVIDPTATQTTPAGRGISASEGDFELERQVDSLSIFRHRERS